MPDRLAPRPYADTQDLQAMEAVLVDGHRTANGLHYVHVGDLRWWLFYLLSDEPIWPHITLWESPAGQTVGWTLLSPRDHTFDVFLHPDWASEAYLAQTYQWSAAQLAGLAQAQGWHTLYKMWNTGTDVVTQRIMQQLGFAVCPDEQMAFFRYALPDESVVPGLPSGFVFRACQGEVEVAARAEAQAAAFKSSLPLERYVARWRGFMRTAAYVSAHDWVIQAPDGRIAAFCITWYDYVNRVGLLEPLGVHPDFQRLGLGQAIVAAALNQMRACGLTSAQVCTGVSNQAAIGLYLKTGFTRQNDLISYSRSVNG